MKASQIAKEIEDRIRSLSELMSALKKTPASKTKGELFIAKSHGKQRCYEMTEDGSRLYLGKDKQERLAPLAQKRYETMLQQAASTEILQLQACLKRLAKLLQKHDIDSVYDTMEEPVRHLITRDPITDKGYADKWLRQRYQRRKTTESHKFTTIRGDRVVSKSEEIIADRLNSRGIPYRYEQILILNPHSNLYYFPDFTILNVRTRKEIYWEHLGMVDKNDYWRDNLKKLSDYAQYGYIPGKNLILSFECTEQQLSTEYVDSMIENFLV